MGLKGSNLPVILATVGVLSGSPEGTKAELNPQVSKGINDTKSHAMKTVDSNGTQWPLIALNNEVEEGSKPESILDRVDTESDKFLTEVVKGKYNVNLTPKQEESILGAIRGVFLGNDIKLINTGLKLFSVSEDIRNKIQEDLKKEVENLQPFLKKTRQEVMLAYRDITLEEEEIDKELEVLAKKKAEVYKQLAKTKAELAETKAELAETKALEKEVERTITILLSIIEKEKDLNKKKIELQKQKGPMRA